MSDSLLNVRNEMIKYQETDEEKELRLAENARHRYNWNEVKDWPLDKIFSDEGLVLRINIKPNSKKTTINKLYNALEEIKKNNETLKKNCPIRLVWYTNEPETRDKGDVFKLAFRNPYDLLVFKKFGQTFNDNLLEFGFHGPLNLLKKWMEKDQRTYESMYRWVVIPKKGLKIKDKYVEFNSKDQKENEPQQDFQ